MDYMQFRLRVPYGKWTCVDGREVIFNREYWPILERYPGKKAKPADPYEWVCWIKQEHYFDDGNSPWLRCGPRGIAGKTLKRCNQILAEWGYPPLVKPDRGTLLEQTHRVNPHRPRNVSMMQA